jgi:hypothetical protein
VTYLRKELRSPMLHVIQNIEAIMAARDSTRRELLSRRVTDRQLRALIARYDEILLAAMNATENS